jgi:DNA-binding transcriptional ArsR family regulator
MSKMSKQIEELAALAKALGHPARLEIVKILLMTDSCYCGDIVKELPLAQSTVSQHLKELKSAGIVQGSVSGKNVCYCINPKVIRRFEDLFKELISNQLKDSSSCC